MTLAGGWRRIGRIISVPVSHAIIDHDYVRSTVSQCSAGYGDGSKPILPNLASVTRWWRASNQGPLGDLECFVIASTLTKILCTGHAALVGTPRLNDTCRPSAMWPVTRSSKRLGSAHGWGREGRFLRHDHRTLPGEAGLRFTRFSSSPKVAQACVWGGRRLASSCWQGIHCGSSEYHAFRRCCLSLSLLIRLLIPLCVF